MQFGLKRLIDLLIAGTALLVLSPIMIATWLAIKIEDGGSAIYVSRRVGRAYQIFDLFKFRSMCTGADHLLSEMKDSNQYANGSECNLTDECPHCKSIGGFCSPLMMQDQGPICERKFLQLQAARDSGVFLKFRNDPRVTRVGRFIRKTSIDELPQLFNVLRGDMSIVGNRPLPLYEAEFLTKDAIVARFRAPAGLTGLWQVTQRGTGNVTASDRIALDNDYAVHQSLLGDLKIILKTIPALLQAESV